LTAVGNNRPLVSRRTVGCFCSALMRARGLGLRRSVGGGAVSWTGGGHFSRVGETGSRRVLHQPGALEPKVMRTPRVLLGSLRSAGKRKGGPRNVEGSPEKVPGGASRGAHGERGRQANWRTPQGRTTELAGGRVSTRALRIDRRRRTTKPAPPGAPENDSRVMDAGENSTRRRRSGLPSATRSSRHAVLLYRVSECRRRFRVETRASPGGHR